MEIKVKLLKPYTDKQRMDFIVENNHEQGYEIRETETELQAWGYTEEEKKEQERKKLDMLSLTKREVFLALYNDKGITPEAIKEYIKDPESLIEFEYANDYFRGNPLIDAIGQTLGYSSEQLDYLFEHKEFPKKEEPTEEINETTTDYNI